MTLTNLTKAPFPWFGGKRRAAPLVWQLLGDVDHYVEPFFGSGAVMLERPHPCNRAYHSETVNDLDGFVVNAWRSVAASPLETAAAASWPVAEADKTARQIRLLEWRSRGDLERLAGDADWHDPVMAGWWLWAVSVQIGAFSGDGPWISDPATGRIKKQPRAPRETGVRRDLPHLANDGRGVNRPQAREPGVEDDYGYHPTTMPELARWFAFLSARLRHVRILNGDWARLVTTGASHTLPVRQGGHVGVLLDPPYDSAERARGLYQAHTDSGSVAAEVRAWCAENGENPRKRIVLCGYDTEHSALEALGWTAHEWFAAGFLTGGMGNTGQGVASHQQTRERVWASPHCLAASIPDEQLALADV